MRNNYILLLVAALAFMIILFGCGGGNIASLPVTEVATWNGTWASSKVISTGTISMTITQSGTTFSGSMTLTGYPCFSSAPIAAGTVAGNSISWSSQGIGEFTGTISGASIIGNYAVTLAGACFGDAGIFSVTRM